MFQGGKSHAKKSLPSFFSKTPWDSKLSEPLTISSLTALFPVASPYNCQLSKWMLTSSRDPGGLPTVGQTPNWTSTTSDITSDIIAVMSSRHSNYTLHWQGYGLPPPFPLKKAALELHCTTVSGARVHLVGAGCHSEWCKAAPAGIQLLCLECDAALMQLFFKGERRRQSITLPMQGVIVVIWWSPCNYFWGRGASNWVGEPPGSPLLVMELHHAVVGCLLLSPLRHCPHTHPGQRPGHLHLLPSLKSATIYKIVPITSANSIVSYEKTGFHVCVFDTCTIFQFS